MDRHQDKPSKADAEAFVRRVIEDAFHQKVDDDTLRAVAEKVTQAVVSEPPKPAD